MMIQRIIKSLMLRFTKTFNTFYYLLNKGGILVVNAPLFQQWNKVRQYNIGDDLNYYLLKALSGKKILAYWSFYHFGKAIPNVMAIGSVIDWMGNWQTTVWGSGILYPPHTHYANANNIQ